MIIRKKLPRPHASASRFSTTDHPRPVTRRDFVAAGFLSGPAVVMAPAWLGRC